MTQRERVRLDSLAFGGDAVARTADGRVVFVSGGAPGDLVEVRIDSLRRGFARATPERVLERGPSRVDAACSLASRCGGCQWQEVALGAQREAKYAIVARALGRLGVEVGALVAPTGALGYRTRARLTIGEDGAVGFQERRSHQVVDLDSCPLLDPALDRALAEARRGLAGALSAGGTISGLVGRGGAVHLAVAGLGAKASPLSRALVGRAGISGVAIAGGPRIGAPDVDTSDDGEPPFYAAADGFAQASALGNRALRGLVAEAARARGARVLELHAGDGNFTRDLAGEAASVEAIEGDPSAVERLRRNVPSALPCAEPVEHAVRRRAADGRLYDLVVIDPPRTGLPRGLHQPLAQLAPRLVYVSCDPMTLARDAALLATVGLAPRRATPIDLMPQTYHVETVCELER